MKLYAIKPFIPSGDDFDLARDFFTRLGFKENWSNEENGLCEFQYGDAIFLLQKYQNQEMQDNLMMSVAVDDLEAYWATIEASGVLEMKGVRSKPPTDYPWGQREIHLIDPAGVFWHIVQSD